MNKNGGLLELLSFVSFGNGLMKFGRMHVQTRVPGYTSTKQGQNAEFSMDVAFESVVVYGVVSLKASEINLIQEDRLSRAGTRMGLTVGAELGLSDQKISFSTLLYLSV
ncbi:hypothetical protein QL285_087424 [Trifolium repens]|nr:hypothetical protein QL285_087424 [Trifolium repens]